MKMLSLHKTAVLSSMHSQVGGENGSDSKQSYQIWPTWYNCCYSLDLPLPLPYELPFFPFEKPLVNFPFPFIPSLPLPFGLPEGVNRFGHYGDVRTCHR